MLKINAKIHDKYTLEFKVGYARSQTDLSVSNFVMDTWIFIPDALYINDKTYSKSDFYRDFRTQVRLITPVYSLQQLGDEREMPLSRLEEAGRMMVAEPNEQNEKAYEHQIKMYGNMVRSALRTAVQRIEGRAASGVVAQQTGILVRDLRRIFSRYRALPAKVNLSLINFEQQLYWALCDEYMCRVTDMYLFRLLDSLSDRFGKDTDISKPILDFIEAEQNYQREKGYKLPAAHEEEKNKAFLHRTGQLKKYIESDLYVLAHKKSNTFVFQQLFFMISAGLSMVFATIISFSFQQTYGNFTLPLFIALVVSYMFKDRIKDLMHYWFSSRIGAKFYDYKIKLAMHGEPIGRGKEGCDFVSEEKVPQEIKVRRGRVSGLEAGHSSLSETVIVHRHQVRLSGKRLSQLSHHPLLGVNEIVRINLREFLRRTDSPHIPLYIYEGNGAYDKSPTEKVYYLHFVMRIKYKGIESYRRYRVQVSRRGVREMIEW